MESKNSDKEIRIGWRAFSSKHFSCLVAPPVAPRLLLLFLGSCQSLTTGGRSPVMPSGIALRHPSASWHINLEHLDLTITLKTTACLRWLRGEDWRERWQGVPTSCWESEEENKKCIFHLHPFLNTLVGSTFSLPQESVVHCTWELLDLLYPLSYSQ